MRAVEPTRESEGAPGDETAQDGAPHGVTLVDHAQISAEIAEGDRPTAAILERRGLSEAAWNQASMYWMKRLGDDALENGQNARMAIVFSDAFGQAQDAIKPVPPMDPVGWATLTVEIQKLGGPARPLAARGLSTADYLRLARHFARRLSSDPVAAKEYFDAYQGLQPPAEEIA